jgi:hypothetical protein
MHLWLTAFVNMVTNFNMSIMRRDCYGKVSALDMTSYADVTLLFASKISTQGKKCEVIGAQNVSRSKLMALLNSSPPDFG